MRSKARRIMSEEPRAGASRHDELPQAERTRYRGSYCLHATRKARQAAALQRRPRFSQTKASAGRSTRRGKIKEHSSLRNRDTSRGSVYRTCQVLLAGILTAERDLVSVVDPLRILP